MNATAAKDELWRRYDAGDLTAEDVEARLVLLERAAGDDEAAVKAALDGPIPVHRRRSTRRVAVAALAALAVAGLAGGIVTLASAMSDDSDGSGDADQGRIVTFPAGGGVVVVEGDVGAAVPVPAPTFPDVATTVVEDTVVEVDDEG